jgi:hypothetical protein
MVEVMRAYAANMAQRWMKLDGFYHRCPRTLDAGLHLWMEVVGGVGNVDGQLMDDAPMVLLQLPLMTGTGGDDAHAVEALRLRPFLGGRSDLIVEPRACN